MNQHKLGLIVTETWDDHPGIRFLVYGDYPPSGGIMDWLYSYLQQFYGVDNQEELSQELVETAGFVPDETGEFNRTDLLEFARTQYEIDLDNLMEEVTTKLHGIQQIFLQKEFRLSDSLNFEYTKGRSESWNTSLLSLFIGVDQDFSPHGHDSDAALKHGLGIEDAIAELDFLRLIDEILDGIEQTVETWGDWVEDNGMGNAEQALYDLYAQSRNEVVELTRVEASVGLWRLNDFISKSAAGKLDIDPIYQRNDVWSNAAAISLIRSILRGIPLPSVILWENQTGHYQVIDGKQRISSILRYYGAHPTGTDLMESKMPALKDYLISKLPSNLQAFEDVIRNKSDKKLAQAVLGHDDVDLPKKVKIPSIRTWGINAHYGPSGPSEVEIKKKFLPFKLDTKQKDSTVSVMKETSGKFYWQIKHIEIEEGDETVKDRFESGTTSYQIPVIIFDRDTTPKQIRQVFKLYNSTGLKLNATEQNNAAYQDLLSLKLMLSVCRIRPERGEELYSDVTGITYNDVKRRLDDITLLDDFGLRTTRFNHMKILSWVMSLLYRNTEKPDGTIATPSTTAFIESFFENEGNNTHFLTPSFDAALKMFVDASELLHSNDNESVIDALSRVPVYANKKGKQDEWDDLAAVAIMVASCLVVRSIDDWKELAEKDETIEKLGIYMTQNKLPDKQQTKLQWAYFAEKIQGFCNVFGITKDNINAEAFQGHNLLQNLHELPE